MNIIEIIRNTVLYFQGEEAKYQEKRIRDEKTINRYQSSASRITDDKKLHDEFKNSSGLKKAGIARELEDRGYKRK